MRSRLAGWSTAAVVLVLLTSSCFSEEPVDGARLPLTAYCTAMVEGTGVVDVETDYLPHVVNCENGAASFEALKAQAVSARSYLYYKLGRGGTITDGTGDQVYSCGREPTADHYRAVEETAGEVLRYAGTQVAAFYVAGAHQAAPECRGGIDDPTNTERYVTYNEGLSGDSIEQTTLGWVDPANHANRGCMSQNGSHCLAGMGWRHDDILRFYYGMDIEMVRAEGDCVAPPDAGTATADAGTEGGDGGSGPPDAGVPVADDASTPTAADGGLPAVELRGSGHLSGGCSTTARASRSAGWPLWGAAILLAARHRRRRRP